MTEEQPRPKFPLKELLKAGPDAAKDRAGPGVARHLMVSLSTVRTHTRTIYAKLGVSSRRAAVRRAAELGLLTPAPQH